MSSITIEGAVYIDIREAARFMDTSEMYVRQMLLKGKLQGRKDEAGKWFIPQAILEAKRAGKVAVGTTYLVNCSKEQAKVIAAMPGVSMKKRFDSAKAKSYRLRRAAKKAATEKTKKPVA